MEEAMMSLHEKLEKLQLCIDHSQSSPQAAMDSRHEAFAANTVVRASLCH